MRDHLELQLLRTTTKVQTGHNASAEAIKAFEADCVVIATGAEPDLPNLPDVARVATIETAMAQGRDVWAAASVAILDSSGSWATLSAAETLASWGAAVTIISSPDSPLWDINIYSRMTAMERLRTVGVKVRASVEVLAVERDAITIRERLTGDELRLTGFTAACAPRAGAPITIFLNALEAAGITVYAIGDALATTFAARGDIRGPFTEPALVRRHLG